MSFVPLPGVRVLGITGYARHGKDTLARYLIETVAGAERFAFSDLLAARARLEGRMDRRDPGVLQNERVDRDYLLRAMYRWIEDRAPVLAIVTGVRKADEMQMIRDMGGEVIRVVRTEDGVLYEAHDRDNGHAIEQDISGLHEDASVVAASGDFGTLQRFAVAWAGDTLGVVQVDLV